MTSTKFSQVPAAQHHDQAVLIHEAVRRLRDRFGSVQNPTFVERLVIGRLDDLLKSLTAIIRMRCPERPERLGGAPLDMYRCSYCGCMVAAGVPHTPHDDGCWLGLAPVELPPERLPGRPGGTGSNVPNRSMIVEVDSTSHQ